MEHDIRKTHILIECLELIASVRVGVIEPLRYFVEQNQCEVRFKKTMKITWQDIAWSDAIFCVRGFNKQSYEIMKVAKKYKRKLIYFLDDDLLDLPQNVHSSDVLTVNMIAEYLPKILSISDQLMVVNKLIGEKYSKLTGVPYFISAVPCVITKKENNMLLDNNINILYAGSVDHTEQVRKFITPAIKRILNENINVHATFIGTDPGIKHDRIKFYKFFNNYDEYKNKVQNGNFHIGLAPIKETTFYKSKYFNKYIEYTSVGAVGVYTDSEPYSLVIQNGENGVLCKNNVDAWYQSIKQLVENNLARKIMLNNAENNIAMIFNYENVAKKIFVNMPWLLSYRHNGSDASHIKGEFKPITFWTFYVEKALICWKEKGIKGISFLIRKTIKIIGLKLMGRL